MTNTKSLLVTFPITHIKLESESGSSCFYLPTDKSGDVFVPLIEPKDIKVENLVEVLNRTLSSMQGISADDLTLSQNGIENKLYLNLVESDPYLYKAAVVKSISIISNSNGAVLELIKHDLVFSKKTNKIVYKNKTEYRLVMQDSAGFQLTINNKPAKRKDTIFAFFRFVSWALQPTPRDSNRDLKLVRDSFIQHFFDTPAEALIYPLVMLDYYQVKNNKDLKELPWTSLQLTVLYRGVPIDMNEEKYKSFTRYELYKDLESRYKGKLLDINKKITNGDTRSAVDVCFFGCSLPRSVRSTLIGLGPLFLFRQVYLQIEELIDKRDVNDVLSLVQWLISDCNEKNLNHRAFSERFLDALKAYDIGFSVKQIKKADETILEDTITMYWELRRIEGSTIPNIPNASNKIEAYHDLLSLAIIKFTPSHLLHLYKRYTSKKPASFTVNKITIREPFSAAELYSVGNKTRTCIASYAPSYFLEELDIALVVDEADEYIGMIEIQENTIVQAQLKFNKPILTNPQVHAVVTQWAAIKGYKIGSSDLGVSNIKTVKSPPSKEKELLIEKFYKESNNTNL